MNDTSLESILEEAFQSVLRSSFPHTTASIVIDHPIVDLSFSTAAAAIVADETVIHRENVDVSYSNQQNVSRSTSHVLHDTLILYQNYQENMRLYQNNVSMMVRHLQNIDRRSPFTRQRSRNSGDHEIHNFPFYGIFPVGTTGSSSESYDIPTINHFTNATEYCIYDRETMGGTRSCPITLDEFQDNEQICRIKHCRHIFKSVALQNWFSRNAHCPVCRYDIRRSII
jgi:hypothetical protein